MNKKYDSIHFNHDVTYYVPVFQNNPDGYNNKGYPTFTYEISMADTDQQMVASLNPDYILVLTGKFDAKTQPFDMNIVDHNWSRKSEE